MTTFKNIDDFLRSLDKTMKKVVPDLVAETVVEYSKNRFTYKDWDGQRWKPVKHPVKKGSLLLRSSKLMNTIRPVIVNPKRVRIRAGSRKVPYAKAHNEGAILKPRVTPKMKKFAWAKYYQTKDPKWKGLALTKKTRLTIVIPKRQFLGKSNRLNQIIIKRITGVMNNIKR